MLEGQMLKMAAAALGITPEEVQQTMAAIGSFVATAEKRMAEIERMVAEIHAAAYPPGSLQLIDGQTIEVNAHEKEA